MSYNAKYMLAGRGGGKTFELMKWVDEQENPGDIAVVTNSRHEAERLKRAWMKKYPDSPDDRTPRFVTMSAARSGALNGRNTRIVIDNLDIILSHLLPYPIDFITANGGTHVRKRA